MNTSKKSPDPEYEGCIGGGYRVFNAIGSVDRQEGFQDCGVLVMERDM